MPNLGAIGNKTISNNKMKKLFTLGALSMVALGASAFGQFKLSDAAPFDADFAYNTKVTSVEGITMWFGDGNEDATADADAAKFKKAAGDGNAKGQGYTFSTAGNGVNGNKPKGTIYTFAPEADGYLTVAIILNADKQLYVTEDGVALEDYNGKKWTTKYYGEITEFPVKAGKIYRAYCSGSKMGFYGFNYTEGSALPATVEAAISSTTGYATFSSPYALDFTNVTTLKAYTVTAVAGSTLTLTQVMGTVPAATGLIVEGATADIPVVATSTTDVSSNLLVAANSQVTAAQPATDDKGKTTTNYVLVEKDGKAGFLQVGADSEPKVAAGHAFLRIVTEAAAAPEFISFANGVTAIKGVAVEKSHGQAFDLLGRQLTNAKGLVVKNGKKYIVK
jgi:hypothetical protein